MKNSALIATLACLSNDHDFLYCQTFFGGGVRDGNVSLMVHQTTLVYTKCLSYFIEYHEMGFIFMVPRK